MKTVVSFSGGKSSAYMARMLQLTCDSIIYIFANTSQEREETLSFVNECSIRWGMKIIWVEAEVHHGERIGTGHRVVTYETASRNGEPFEDMIKKYGLPNKSYPHCTRELKLAPIYSYLKQIGLIDDYNMAIGIRADEPRRIRKDAKDAGIIYPLKDQFPTSKYDVDEWWSKQEFNLHLLPHEGNCSWCWKKSLNKHFKLIDSNPEIFDFPNRMEMLYAETNSKHGRRVMFRENRTVRDLFLMQQQNKATVDDTDDIECGESCDINAIV